MQDPTIPENEKERIEALRAYDLLDQNRHPEFDEIVRLAAFICDTPISMISVVGVDEQRFIGNHGLPVDSSPRSISFCAHAINDIHQPLIIEDTTKDERFNKNPFVTGEPYIAFYAGYPLYTSDDYGIGTLCVIDKKPKILSEDQKRGLQILAKQVIRLFELRKSIKEAAEKEATLQQAVNGLEEYTAIVAHDLKTSLRNIEISTELLIKKKPDNLDAACQEYLNTIQNETKESIQFINDILKYSKSVHSFNDSKSRVNMNQLLNDICDRLNIPSHFDISIHIGLPMLYTSRSAIQHVFENLIQNSVKYMDKDYPSIAIKYILAEKYYIFKVVDNGSGIPKSRQQQIFQIYNRAQREENNNSFGVGLASVNRLVTLLGGIIQLESEVGKGSCFIIYLPKEMNAPS